MIRVTCVTIDCDDPARASAFWADALGWWQVGGHRAEPADGGIYLEFMKVPEAKTVKNRVHLGLNTPDLDAEIERLRRSAPPSSGKSCSRRTGPTATSSCATRKVTSSVWAMRIPRR